MRVRTILKPARHMSWKPFGERQRLRDSERERVTHTHTHTILSLSLSLSFSLSHTHTNTHTHTVQGGVRTILKPARHMAWKPRAEGPTDTASTCRERVIVSE